MNTQQHYDTLLAPVYSWMIGDFESRSAEQLHYFSTLGIEPKETKQAVDLGCGNGIQTIALARLGFSVYAVDFSVTLLNELKQHAGEAPVTVIESDISAFADAVTHPVDLICCMGDTLTHLPSFDAVDDLIRNAFSRLTDKGKLIISYRDLSTELKGTDRFIPVKSDDTRILTCFLEYLGGNVTVHDILHEKINGRWIQNVSIYQKLIISSEHISNILQDAGFTIEKYESIRGLLHFCAQKN